MIEPPEGAQQRSTGRNTTDARHTSRTGHPPTLQSWLAQPKQDVPEKDREQRRMRAPAAGHRQLPERSPAVALSSLHVHPVHLTSVQRIPPWSALADLCLLLDEHGIGERGVCGKRLETLERPDGYPARAGAAGDSGAAR